MRSWSMILFTVKDWDIKKKQKHGEAEQLYLFTGRGICVHSNNLYSEWIVSFFMK